ncbi:response regulator transcription factor [Actinoplanes oblitus]|uniref:Response regulator transcription factor n=1 Tax=Actinoplanes oblitus TaxID=3040509 RepID=A0ABY8W936_9ACTN|nr:response regulator transcription factor [Actinoplanes oblitus]WIM94356.1 response regulator transcription factor [Actinoplanes oblitus]
MRLILAEDQFLLREGLVKLLEAHGHQVVRAVTDGPALREALAAEDFDVALVDIRLPPTFTDEGLQAALEARRARPGLPVLLLSQYVEQLYATELLADGAGGVGYLLKDRVFDGEQFVTALRTVAGGGTVMDEDVVSGMVGRSDRLASLTARELETLGLVAQGRSNAAIAARMFVTEKAVAKNINSILAKLQLPPSTDDNRRVMAVLAYLGA